MAELAHLISMRIGEGERIPSEPQVQALLSCLYEASLTTEEGRALTLEQATTLA